MTVAFIVFIFSHSWENAGRFEEGEVTLAFVVLLRAAADGGLQSGLDA